MAVVFNGQQRYAICIMHNGPHGPFIQIIGVLASSSDEFLSPDGIKSSVGPPGAPKPN